MLLLVVDLLVVAASFCFAFLVGFAHILKQDGVSGKFYIALPIIIFINGFFSLILGIYSIVWRRVRPIDYLKIIISVLCSTTLFVILDMAVINSIYLKNIPNGIQRLSYAFLIYSLFTTTTISIMIFSRLIYQYFYYRITTKAKSADSKKVLIIGAGNTGNIVVDEILRSDTKRTVLCYLDDDEAKIGRVFNGVKVLGKTKDVVRIANELKIDIIIYAIPSSSLETRTKILNECSKTQCKIKVLPMLEDLVDNADILKQAKKINIEDLLGRPQIKFDDTVKDFIRNKVVMVTGAGGSIGGELSRQLAKLEVKKLILLDIYENTTYEIQQELKRRHGKSLELETEILSVTDLKKLETIFTQYRPNIIFHAAAHKHVPLMETNPEEAVKNNIFGTLNLAELSDKYSVEKFILISTDKAVNPTSVMGATKRCCEKLIKSVAQKSKNTCFSSVRFGNVLGSHGSVIPLFKRQIEEGGPVTVTDKNMIRYFMTISEAVRLVLQTAGYANKSEVFILDMGEPMKILELAEKMIISMGYAPYKDIDIKFIGLRAGEKLYEELLMTGEGLRKTENKKIFIGEQEDFDIIKFRDNIEKMREIMDSNDKEAVIEQLKILVPTFNHDTKSFAKMIKNSK